MSAFSKLSVVVPVYNSQESLESLFQRLKAVFSEINTEFEVVFVNDQSQDDSLTVLKKIKKENPDSVIVVDLFKNYGQQNALMCGFSYCSGDAIITIDDDLQNPPEAIPSLVNKIKEGHDAVFAVADVKKDRAHKNLGSLLVRKLNHIIFKIKNDLRFSSYRIISKDVIDQIKGIHTPFPYISGLILETTNNVVNVTVPHNARAFGRSGYNLRKLIGLAFNLIINYSALPIRILGIVGIIVSLSSLCIGFYFMFKQITAGLAPTGWTTLVVIISFYNSLILVMAFVFGEYVKRILRELSNYRPYSIRNTY